jgi:ABC-type nitrate/sulfonate/bicarbonate transport system permease component
VTTTSLPFAPTSPPPLRGLAGLAKANERLLYGLLGFAVLCAIWETAGDVGLYRKSLLSTPSQVFGTAVADFGSGLIWPHLATSGSEFAIGFGLALVVGVPLGLLIGMFERLDHFLSVLLYGIYSTPKAAIAPLIILVAGIGLESKVIFVFLLAFFSFVVSTMSGVHAVSEKHLDIARSFGASPWLTFRTVILPSTFPFILTGLRISAGRALVGVVIAEELAANEGIGHYIELYGTFLQTNRVMLGIVILGLFGIAFGEVVRRIERRFEAWRPEVH